MVKREPPPPIYDARPFIVRTRESLVAPLDRIVTAERVRDYSLMLVAGYLLGWSWVGFHLHNGLDAQGKPFGADFIIFYGASKLTLAGKAALAYSSSALLAAERVAVPASRRLFLWCYPPTFQLVIWPLALFPYLTAFAIWTGLGVSAYLAMIRQISRDRRVWLLAVAFPGVFLCATQGQTGLIVAALMGGGLLLLDRRPLIAGALIGLLAIKPHLGVLLPILLMATGRWKAILAAAASALLLAGSATFAFGVESWTLFLSAARAAGRALANGSLPIYKDPSMFAGLLRLGAPVDVAMALHLLLAVLAAAITVRAWRRPGPHALKAGLAIIATLIILPYSFDYDLVLLAAPIAAALKATLERQPPVGVRSALVLLAVLPIVLAPLGELLWLPIGPVALWCGLFALLALLRQTDGELAANVAPLPSPMGA